MLRHRMKYPEMRASANERGSTHPVQPLQQLRTSAIKLGQYNPTGQNGEMSAGKPYWRCVIKHLRQAAL